MTNYRDVFLEGYQQYAGYLWREITQPSWNSYFYWLIGVSLFFFLLEVVIPWRRNQPVFRKDFWLDAFYMFFNYFLFSLIIYSATTDVIVELLNNGIKWVSGGFDLQASNPMNAWPVWAILLTGFLVRDFIQWWVHRLLHRSETLWNFHKVHHSVEEMGFAAHLRYHWMETIVYRTIEYLPLALLGIGLHDFFIIHIFTLAWGHYNHANIRVSGFVTGGILGLLAGVVIANGLLEVHLLDSPGLLTQLLTVAGLTAGGSLLLGGVMKYLFNGPEMHIWHHAHDLPEERHFGVNFGLTLAIWDYIFGTAYVPRPGRDIELGFTGMEELPDGFGGQATYGFKPNHQ